MVRAVLDLEQPETKSRLNSRAMTRESAGRQAYSMIEESSFQLWGEDDGASSRSQPSIPPSNEPLERQRGFALTRLSHCLTPRLPVDENLQSLQIIEKLTADMELMKERFTKLLLGEDMSGGGEGVSSALALSNAITNLAASVFGEQKRLEPMAPETKARWRREIDWLLSVTDHIVEFAPAKQKSKDGTDMEIMTTRQRSDLHMNIPALRKLDTMLLDCLDNFKDQNEFTYVSKDHESDKGNNKRKDEKWWIPTPKVPPNGLSEITKRWLQSQKDSVNQVLKAAMAINAQVLSEMKIPETYIESLPKNGRSSLGDSAYRSITVEDNFDPGYFLSTMDLSSEHKIVDLKDRIEASLVIWRRKMHAKDGKSAWGSAVSLEKRELFEERAATVLLIIKHRFPGIPQSALDISKIEHNRDVGHAVLESYSRILESLAFTVLSRIEDVLHADSQAQNPSHAEEKRHPRDANSCMVEGKFLDAQEEVEKLNSAGTSTSMTLSDFICWNTDQGETEKTDSANDLLKTSDTAKPLSRTPTFSILAKEREKLCYTEA